MVRNSGIRILVRKLLERLAREWVARHDAGPFPTPRAKGAPPGYVRISEFGYIGATGGWNDLAGFFRSPRGKAQREAMRQMRATGSDGGIRE